MPTPSPVSDIRAEKLGRIPPRADEIVYPKGHVWKRHRDHETMVLRVKQQIEDLAA